MRQAYLCVVLFAVAAAYSQELKLDSAAITIRPQETDSYNLEGHFTNLSLDGATSITIALGQFVATIPLSAFAQEAGTNRLTYQESSGVPTYWVTALTLDPDTSSFRAQADGIVLAGLPNPFAFRLGTNAGVGCVMTRVAATAPGEFASSGAASSSTPCAIAGLPTTDHSRILAGTATPITVTATVSQKESLGDGPLQVFRADTSAQPVGDPLCTLTAAAAGDYSCQFVLNELAPGPIPFVVAGSGGTQTILSAGFSIQVVGPYTAAASQQVMDIQDAMGEAGAFFHQYGDSVQSRVLAMRSLRKLLQPPASLTGHPIALTPDGLSIDADSDIGLSVTMLLNNLGSVAAGDASRNPPQSPATVWPATLPRSAHPVAAAAPREALQCGQFSRKIVKNNGVLLWDPWAAWDPVADAGPYMIASLESSVCPHFAIQRKVGPEANVASLRNFSDYGTIIMFTHGAVTSKGRFYFMTGEKATPPFQVDITETTGVFCVLLNSLPEANPSAPAIKPVLSGCFVTVGRSHPDLQRNLTNTVVWGGFCDSAGAVDPVDSRFLIPSPWADVFAPRGSGSAFFGFNGRVLNTDDGDAALAVFRSFLKDYTSSADAQQAALAAAGFKVNLEMRYENNLAYVGNPVVRVAGLSQPYRSVPDRELTLQASMDGTNSCNELDGAKYLAAKWNNSPATGGHLQDPQGFFPDNFANEASEAIFGFGSGLAARGLYQTTDDGGADDITVDFLPDPANPPAARACTRITVAGYSAGIGNENGVPMTLLPGIGPNGAYTLKLDTKPGAKDSTGQPMLGSATFTFKSTPEVGIYNSAGNKQIDSASAVVTFKGQTYQMTCPPFDPVPGRESSCGFTVQFVDMSNPMKPKGVVETTGRNGLAGISLNFYFPGPFLP